MRLCIHTLVNFPVIARAGSANPPRCENWFAKRA